MFVPTLISLLALASTAIAAPATLPMMNIPSLVKAASTGQGTTLASGSSSGAGTSIEFEQCASVGNVTEVTIEPCQGGKGTLDSPCEFSYGSNYTITLHFTSTITSSAPRANLIAKDTSGALGAGSRDHYAYSGQSFDGCRYTSCPVEPDVESTYTYEFKTLKSQFEALTFNVTDTLQGPSFLCAGFPIKFNP